MEKTGTLVTGATGFLGQQTLTRILRSNRDETFYLLIRPSNRANAAERLSQIRQELPEDLRHSKLELVEGNTEAPRLGLSESQFSQLSEKIRRIVHSAAIVQLEMPIEDMRRHNLRGVENTLTLAREAGRRGGFEHFFHVSTAYVAGKRRGRILETDLNLGQEFNNSYEQVKMEAETLVENAKQEFAATVFRPSMIMGDSQTGWTNSFNVLYIPIRLAYLGKLPIAPKGKTVRVDTVPVNFVADAMAHLIGLGPQVAGKTFHLTVGVGRSVSPEELFESGLKAFEKYVNLYGLKHHRRLPHLIPLPLFRLFNFFAANVLWGPRKRLYQRFRQTVLPYAVLYKEFDTSQAEQFLGPAGIICPRLVDYMDPICKYCVDTHFGTSAKPRDVLV